MSIWELIKTVAALINLLHAAKKLDRISHLFQVFLFSLDARNVYCISIVAHRERAHSLKLEPTDRFDMVRLIQASTALENLHIY